MAGLGYEGDVEKGLVEASRLLLSARGHRELDVIDPNYLHDGIVPLRCGAVPEIRSAGHRIGFPAMAERNGGSERRRAPAPTLAEVARRAGVSIATASRVASGQDGVRDSTRQRVEQAIAATEWIASPAARALAGGKGDEVGLVIAVADAREPAEDPYYARVIAGASEEAARHGLVLSVQFASHCSLAKLAPFVGDRRYVGAVVVNVDGETAGFLSGRGTPVVSLGASAPGVPALDPENSDGSRRVVEHLLSQGRRRVMMIGGPPGNPCARDRSAGYRLAMRSARLPAFELTTDFTRDAAAGATRRLLDADQAIDAIFVASDFMGTAVLQVLAENGRRVPDDVAVVGFDDSAPARMTTPQLTTVHAPVEQLAGLAVRTLVEPASQRQAHRRLPTRLVVRASSVA
jgi:DNA-binding LacI/PurR family transcriptional regulator